MLSPYAAACVTWLLCRVIVASICRRAQCWWWRKSYMNTHESPMSFTYCKTSYASCRNVDAFFVYSVLRLVSHLLLHRNNCFWFMRRWRRWDRIVSDFFFSVLFMWFCVSSFILVASSNTLSNKSFARSSPHPARCVCGICFTTAGNVIFVWANLIPFRARAS